MQAISPSQVVFALTSRGHDVFSVMTRLAVASLRISNPGLRVMIACDSRTDAAMRGADDPLIGEVDAWMAVEAADGTAEFLNRHVKTRLRSLIAGPFLFLDSDTFVRGNLGEIFALDCDIAGARNHSREDFVEQVWDQDRATLTAMDWRIGDEIYINGGVLFFNETEGARRLAAEWHGRWLESAARSGNFRDQPAFNSALAASNPRLAVLPDRFNAQVELSPDKAVDAVIWHYYSSVSRLTTTVYDVLVRDLLEGKRLDRDEIRRYVECRHPWTDEGLIDIGKQLAALRNENSVLKQDLKVLRRDLDGLRGEYEKVLASKSWLVTRPLRAIDALGRQWLADTGNVAKDSPTDK